MSGDEKQDSHRKPPAEATRTEWESHEVDDINVWAILKFAIGLLILGIFSYIALYGLLKVFKRQRLAAEGPLPAMARGAEDRLPPPPRLQMMPGSPSEFKTPEYEMKAMLEEEDKTLESYGWVDKNSGVVRIPIDEAMKLVLQKGLPSRPSASGQSSPSPAQGK
jgi:hypothetical protein